MDWRKVLGLSVVAVLIAIYLVQNPIYSLQTLSQELQDKVVVICGASTGESLLLDMLHDVFPCSQ